MSGKRSRGTSRAFVFLNTLLVTTALTIPAYAQIEEVVVTAQKKTEDIQTVPISVTAFTQADLQQQQITQFKDLQFHDPSLTYTPTNFAGTDIQIRGLGITAIGNGDESSVALDFDEVYILNPILTETSFVDLSGVEILAGPQSTLFGRGASGGAININVAKPDLDSASGQLTGDYGNYNYGRVQGIVNIPIVTDELGLRIAGDWDRRDGFVTNLYNDSKVDGLDEYTVRSTLRWQPTERTTVDLTGNFWSEDDSHMRSDKARCTTDPTGILGCLPTSAGNGYVNGNALQSTLLVSQQGLDSLLYGELINAGASPPIASFGAGLASQSLGLFNVEAPFALPSGYPIPTGDRQVDSDIQPHNREQDNFLSLKWQQNVTSWLDSTLIGGYDNNSYWTTQSFTNLAGYPLATANPATACAQAAAGSPNITCAQQSFVSDVELFAGLEGVANPAAYAATYAPYLKAGMIPFSGIGSFGETGGNYTFTADNAAHDLADGASTQYSVEWRLATKFSGPFNGLLGFYYLHAHSTSDYIVTASTFDWLGVVTGGLLGGAFPQCQTAGCIFGPTYYHNQGADSTLTSKAVFGEFYYDVLPDTVKFTLGARFTEDTKFDESRILQPGDGGALFYPIGTNTETADATQYVGVHSEFDKWTGRAVLDWTPKLAFTDQTLVYTSASRGYKAGGANPGYLPNQPPALQVPSTYNPEFINDYELGTKNQLLGNTLQANGDLYYYDYSGLQVSSILNNTSVNENVNAKIWGAEGSLLWAPTERWQFGFNIAHEDSSIENANFVDPRNPTGGASNVVLIKSDNALYGGGQNCVLYFNGASPPPLGPGFSAITSSLAPYGIKYAAFGQCGGAVPAGYTSYALGVPVSLKGNELQLTPQLSLNLGAQYTQPLPSEFNLVARVDVHFQTHMWMRIFEDGGDYIGNEETVNAFLQLNSPNDVWYTQAFIKNIFNQNNITGGALNSASAGLYTNTFYGDPRTFGLEFGIKFQ